MLPASRISKFVWIWPQLLPKHWPSTDGWPAVHGRPFMVICSQIQSVSVTKAFHSHVCNTSNHGGSPHAQKKQPETYNSTIQACLSQKGYGKGSFDTILNRGWLALSQTLLRVHANTTQTEQNYFMDLVHTFVDLVWTWLSTFTPAQSKAKQSRAGKHS